MLSKPASLITRYWDLRAGEELEEIFAAVLEEAAGFLLTLTFMLDVLEDIVWRRRRGLK